MALDMKKMRAKLDAAKNKGGKTWKPKLDSETRVRVVPTPDGDPFKEKHFHYNVGNQSVLCPKRNFDEECAICDFASELWNEGTEESKEMAKGLFARQRFFSPIVLRDEKDPVVKIWGYSQTVYQDLLSTCLNPEYGDISDPESGTDFAIWYEKGEAQFPSTKLVYSRKSSSLCAELGEKECEDLLNNIPDFDSLYERKSSAEVKDILDAFMAGGGSEDSSDGVEKYSESKKSDEVSSVDGALDDLKKG